ncbi:MAG: hypothetical protein HRT98_04220 [Mycoplasmatales bacterium]|nr:hypothetical protein [Mycoplasmatales bacterium]
MKTINNIFARIILGIFAWLILLIISPIRLLFLAISFVFSFWKLGAIEKFIYNVIFAVAVVIGYWGTTYTLETPIGPKNVYTLVNIFTYKTRINYGEGWQPMGKMTTRDDFVSKINEGIKVNVKETTIKE